MDFQRFTALKPGMSSSETSETLGAFDADELDIQRCLGLLAGWRPIEWDPSKESTFFVRGPVGGIYMTISNPHISVKGFKRFVSGLVSDPEIRIGTVVVDHS